MMTSESRYIDYPRWPDLARESLKVAVPDVGKLVQSDEVEGIVISGMGGSGIVGDIVRDYLFSIDFSKPIIVVKDTKLPPFVNRKYLVLTISYSGNTTETIKCFEECIRKNIPVIAISTGGKLETLAKENNAPHVKVPKATAPRYGLPNLLYPTLKILQQLDEKLRDRISRDIEDSVTSIKNAIESYLSDYRDLVDKFVNNTVMVYVPNPLISIGIRFKNDMNENAKQPVIVCPVPESEHNDLAIHVRKFENIRILVIESKLLESTDYGKHIAAIKNVLNEYNQEFTTIKLEGRSILSEILYGITLLGMLTVDVAHRVGVDPVKIEAIDKVKKYISQ